MADAGPIMYGGHSEVLDVDAASPTTRYQAYGDGKDDRDRRGSLQGDAFYSVMQRGVATERRCNDCCCASPLPSDEGCCPLPETGPCPKFWCWGENPNPCSIPCGEGCP